MVKKKVESAEIDLSPYAGRWVAVVRGHVVGVGWTAAEARRAAKRSRPKEEPRVVFVPAGEVSGDAFEDDGQPA